MSNEQPNNKSLAFVGLRRKDGLYPVQYVYASGVRLNKLISLQLLDALLADERYTVIVK